MTTLLNIFCRGDACVASRRSRESCVGSTLRVDRDAGVATTGTRRRRKGMSLIEISVVIVIIGILLTLVLPAFNRVGEQARLDAAAQYLRSIWSAERVYWLENRTFTTSMASLDSLGLIDPKLLAGSDGFFTYNITAADSTTFTVNATRTGSTVWSGTLTITQDGLVVGSLSGNGGASLEPSEL